MPRVVVVGLGPGGADWLVPAARRALESVPAPARFTRTARHPAVEDLRAEGLELVAFDDVYDGAERLDDVYEEIVRRLEAAAAEHGAVAYAVPGSPVVAERAVLLLRDRGAEIELVPGVSFAELAWSRLGVDALSGARVLDARTLTLEQAAQPGPTLIAQCDRRLVLSDVKLTLLERLDAGTPITVLSHLGLPDEQVRVVPLADLDRAVEPDHLTSLFVDLGAGPTAGSGEVFVRFVELVERLRAPGGCPWDAEQTHHSLARHVIEEAYEVVEAIAELPPDAPGPATPDAYNHLEEELGDLLAQVVFHATLAREAGAFTVHEVIEGIHAKLVRRHPHVFGDLQVSGAEDVLANWEQLKQGETDAASIMASVPRDLPALVYVHKLLRKAEAVGLPIMEPEEAAARAAGALAELPGATGGRAEDLAGEVLARAVMLTRAQGVDAETALRAWAARFRSHFQAVEAEAARRGLSLRALAPDELAALWIEATPTRGSP